MQPAKLTDFKMAGALGSGTTAKVYEAVHIVTGRAVAIKVLEPSQAGSEMRERFAREAVLLAGVASKHVGNIVGFGFERGQPFLVLERLRGETLDAKLRRDGPVPYELAVRWIEQLIVGVRDCHDQQIIHRDIKPSNIFLHTDAVEESVKLIDFGVARLREITGDQGGLTGTNHLIGSMGYMAPEQFRNAKTVGFSADLYAVGVVIFRTLTGRLPFVSRSLEAVIKMKREQDAPAISSMPDVPKNALLDWFVAKAMARRPEDRFQSAREMLEQWWNVVASVEDEVATDVTRAVGAVEESYAGPLRRSMKEAGSGAGQTPLHQALEDDRTLRRLPNGGAAGAASAQGLPSSGERTLLDLAPKTLPNPASVNAATVLQDDPFDIPTKSDPNLRKLVERELELHRKGRGPAR